VRRLIDNCGLIMTVAEAGGSSGQRFNYLFYIDFVGSLADPKAQNALRHLQASPALQLHALASTCLCAASHKLGWVPQGLAREIPRL
jgi:hypothetical protein